MALDYLVGWPRYVHPGKPVGLHGRGLRRFFEARRGMGAFVWPCPLKYEDALLNAGVSLVSDNMDPWVLEKPDGTPRWPRPVASHSMKSGEEGLIGPALMRGGRHCRGCIFPPDVGRDGSRQKDEDSRGAGQ